MAHDFLDRATSANKLTDFAHFWSKHITQWRQDEEKAIGALQPANGRHSRKSFFSIAGGLWFQNIHFTLPRAKPEWQIDACARKVCRMKFRSWVDFEDMKWYIMMPCYIQGHSNYIRQMLIRNCSNLLNKSDTQSPAASTG